MSRLRLIAGPNGSGKSSIFQLIKEFKEKQKVIPTGPFINSDLIEKEFKDKGYIELRLFGVEFPPASLISDYLKISNV
jgi:predicted ABC-type ATPase